MADLRTNIPGERFGIKEVADVNFYTIQDGVDNIDSAIAAYESSTPVISFDTLKVSNIESTAENSEARGGKGNAALISWDYGREVTVTLEDALLSMQTLSLLFENNPSGQDKVIIDANKFPGTYAVIGSTYARSETTGKDEVFKFIIPKAKIQSETTITMEAEGDPSVIGMTLKVLRTKSGQMMGLVKEESADKYTVTYEHSDGKIVTYTVASGTTTPTEAAASGYTWSPQPATTVTKSAYYKAVKTT